MANLENITTPPLTEQTGRKILKAIKEVSIRTKVVDTLDSANSSLALSANQGKKLNENKVDISALIDLIYPIGSIYMSVTQTSPASFLGGSWTPLEEGKALWTTTTASTGGVTIEAGLPNITGSFYVNICGRGFLQGVGGKSGAFKDSPLASDGYYGSGSHVSNPAWDDITTRPTFNASSSNSIYGASTTVQPPAIKVYAWQRTA